MKLISSRQNPLVKRFRDAIREHDQEIVIEGPKAVADAIAAGWIPLAILTSAAASFSPPNVETIALTDEVFNSLAETRNPQGVLGLFERPHASAREILARRDTIAVALDGVQDPGNVGTIVRLAAAFEASGVLLLPGCADAYGPKAIRSSAGAILNVPVADATIDDLRDADLIATAMDGARMDPPSRDAVLIFGNEGGGVSDELLRRATRIAIPMSTRVESLNVASSAAILLARSYQLRA
jgi:TrmH family RNA methyltransferase